LRFGPTQRLRRPAQFQNAYGRGRKFGNEFFSAAVLANNLGVPRLGLSIAARTVGNAVRRNRLRRLIRESFRLQQHDLPIVDIVIGARSLARDATLTDMRAGLERLWKKITAECARSSDSSYASTNSP
jgi:ribonuclease P protein component